MPQLPNGSAYSHLPFGLYGIMIGLAALFVVGAWGFAGTDYGGLALAAVTMLFLVAVILPLALFFGAGRQNTTRRNMTLKDWMHGEFETSQDRVKSSNAMIEILLPLGAVAVGIAVFAIVLHLVPHATAA
jgi:hypothetical protein